MPRPTLPELEAAVRDAQAALETAPDNEKPALQAKVAEGQKAVEEKRLAGMTEEQRLRLRIADLESTIQDQETTARLDGYAEQIARGAKAKIDAETERWSSALDQAVERKMSAYGLTPGVTLPAVIDNRVAQMRTPAAGRKAPDPAEDSTHEQTTMLTKGVPNQISRRGDWANPSAFVLAVGRKALGKATDEEIGKIQMAMGMKALAEGLGATSSVSGPGGGYLVPPEFSTQLIENLYPYLALRSAGVTVIPMRSNTYFQPRLATPMVASYVGESQAVPVSQETYGQFQLTAHKLMGMVGVSRELVADSDPSVEQTVREDMAAQLGVAEDYTFMLGTGSSISPTGILVAAGIQTIAGAGGGDTLDYPMLLDMRTKLAKANIPNIRRFWLMNPDMLGTIQKIQTPAGNYAFSEGSVFSIPSSNLGTGMPDGLPQGSVRPTGILLGFPVYTTTQIPSAGSPILSQLALIEGNQVRIGQRGDIELEAFTQATYIDGSSNTISAVQNDQVVFRAIMRHDIGLRHPQAVVVHTNVKIV